MMRMSVVVACCVTSSLSLHPTDTPGPRFNHAACFDEQSSSLVLFGGRSAPAAGSEVERPLWLGNAGVYQAGLEGPAARSSPVLVCDAAGQRVLMHGGYTRRLHGDTWEFNGTRWALVDSAGLTPRAHSAAALDPSTGFLITFGGFLDGASAPLAETWQLSGKQWTKVDVAGPPARYGHAMVSDPANERIILFGGWSGFGSGNVLLTDTWEWKSGAWKRLESAGPRLLADRTVVARRSGAVVLIGAAEDGSGSMAVWELTAAGWKHVLTTNAPPARHGAAAAWDSERDVIVLHGGITTEQRVLAETWELKDAAWRQLPPN